MAIDSKVSSDDITGWAERRINLSADSAKAYREQGNRLRTKLEKYIDEHEDFDLVKMRNSGSVAKGTALRSKSDMDVGVYVRRAAAPASNHDLVGWLRERLCEAYENLVSPEKIIADDVSVRVEFSGSGVDVECVPILDSGEDEDYGELLLRSGGRVETSISKHITFFQDRKNRHPKTFAQFVRLLRYWRNQRSDEGVMPLSGFAVELIAVHLLDTGLDPGDIPSALQRFFVFLASGGLKDRIVFPDNYPASEAISDGLPIQIIDPVAKANNVTKDLSLPDRDTVAKTAADTLDDLTMARTATSKEAAVTAWRGVFGPEFSL